MLGIIIAVISSNWIGDWILREGVYETDLDADGSVVFLRPHPPPPLHQKTAKDFMARPVWYAALSPQRTRYHSWMIAPKDMLNRRSISVVHVIRHPEGNIVFPCVSGIECTDQGIRRSLLGTLL